VIYELHVKGFTKRAPWLPEELRGTYAGLADPHTIDYLTQLGITSVELLPIFAKCAEPHLSEQGKENYWGYSTLNYFSPEPSYATTRSQERGPQAVRQEVIDMVDALHAAGIEVILDVVYNHSCEGDETGYSLSWRGIDGHSYYRRDPRDGGRLLDSTGTGNTFDFSQTQVITMAVDSLRYWAKRIGVDGFRFDLAVSLARLGETPASHGAAQRHSANGRFTPHHPFLYAIRSDMLLGNLKLIMEPWDTGDNGWRTGQFGLPFSEWNDHFRDVTRQFWLTDAARLHSGKSAHLSMQELATRLCGSADLFATEPGRGAVASINYVCSHDGFTLADLTRYNSKHNDLNGENNHDGSDTNYSFNCGVEGPTANPDVILKRQRASLNMAGTTLLSLGTPMLVAGDEFGRTQDGNNNPYVQDNSISWLDWSWMQQDPLSWQRQRFSSITALISLRTQLEQFHHEAFFTVMSQLGLLTQSDRVQWYLPDGTSPTDADWRDSTRRSFSLRLRSKSVDALLTVNGTATPEDFSIPDDTQWRLLWSSQPLEYEARGAATSLASVRIPELTLSLWEQEQ
jgi:glycogen operon protein